MKSLKSVSPRLQSSLRLSTGNMMPQVGLGTWNSEPGEVQNAVEVAIDCGYRHIDCAHIYGNEKEVGAGLTKKFEEKTVAREDMFIVSKLWNTDHEARCVEPACRLTLKNLGLKYLDLYLIHWPIGFKNTGTGNVIPKDKDGDFLYGYAKLEDTWAAMEKLVEKRLVRQIGLSNFNITQIERMLKVAKVPISVLQIECHPYLNQQKLIRFCKANNIVVTAYSPLGSPARPWASPDDPYILKDPKLEEIAKEYGKTTAHILIRYQVDRGIVVIPKSVTPGRIAANLNVFDFKLKDKHIRYLESFEKGWRACLPTIKTTKGVVIMGAKHPEFPFLEVSA